MCDADTALDELEEAMRDVTCNLPIRELRATLPEAVKQDRSAILELLDILLVDGDEPFAEGLGHRLSAVDYLITLLCADASCESASVRHDPTTLTPKLSQLCQRADSRAPHESTQIEANFYSAAQLEACDTNELDRQKAALGNGFFSTRMLRAVTTYNVSRLFSSESDEKTTAEAEPCRFDTNVSVFDAEPLESVVDGLRRRIGGGPQSSSRVDGVVWRLNLSIASQAELNLLLASPGACRDHLAGSTVLVGLLCRSADVLFNELTEIGIPPEVLVGEWASDLSDAIKTEVNLRIQNSAYDSACELSDLRSKFFPSPSRAEVPEVPQVAAPQKPADNPNALRRSTSEPASEALDATKPAAKSRASSHPGKGSLLNLVKGGAAILTLAFIVAAAALLSGESHPDRISLTDTELARISPYLLTGQRDSDGVGPSFVGSIDQNWTALSTAEREDAAVDIVASLQLVGVQKIMIYDAAQRVRIQVLGEGNVHLPHVVSPKTTPPGPSQ
ncbi:MAG: hypothetical protein VX246_11935 [Myxococcota bacterium]|nr:hypothetical protein [Myxococcota bacterium]